MAQKLFSRDNPLPANVFSSENKVSNVLSHAHELPCISNHSFYVFCLHWSVSVTHLKAVCHSSAPSDACVALGLSLLSQPISDLGEYCPGFICSGKILLLSLLALFMCFRLPSRVAVLEECLFVIHFTLSLKNGEALIKKITSYREIDTLVSYDPKSEQVKNPGVTGSPISFYVDNFVESLVLLDLVNGEFGRQPNCGEKKMLKGKWKIEEELIST
ncbi:hypothetical protein TEA_023174 [Camellia sinensis var. sinensis]|uniref:Uncharacterized protein n=1 Tax=Camellia sinensis var. sinensis TaxID=542762 RepID=A0A4S4EPW2_CAMSN|nr:hypothetical protein TEA_023174 [Camellia sinensis var. sinensis]